MARDITVTLQDGSTHIYKGAPDDITPDAVSARAQRDFGQPVAHLDGGRAAPPADTSQPSAVDQIIASPPGRLLHDVLAPLGSLAVKGPDAMVKIADMALPANHQIPTISDSLGSAYQGALARNRNTPGYTAARALADKASANGPMSQLTAPFNSALAGTAGGILGGSLDSANAASDAQEAAQNNFQSQHPIQSFLGQTMGGLLLAPKLPAPLPAGTAAQTADEAALSYIKGLGADPAKLQAAAASANGKPLTSAEAIGKPAEYGLGALARRDGSTADALAGEMAMRQTQAPDRILDDFASASGVDPRLAKGDIDGYVSAGRQTVKPMFEQALSSDKGVWNTDLARLANRPAVKGAMDDVYTDLLNSDINPEGLGFTGKDPETGRFIQQPRPTAEAWDMVKKRLGMNVERDPFGKIIPDSVSPGNYHLNNANRDLTSALRDAIPGYGDALDASGDYLSMQRAFDDGQNFIMNSKVTAQQVKDHIASLSPSEQQSFKGGIANKLFNLQQNGRLPAKIADAPSVQEKLSAALGQQNADKFISNLQVEKNMANFARTQTPGAGSHTAVWNEAMSQQDNPFNVSPDILNAATTSIQHGPIAGATQYVLNKGKDALSTWATRGMPVPVRDAAGQLLIAPPADLSNALLTRGANIQPTRLLGRIQAPATLPYGLLGSALANSRPQ